MSREQLLNVKFVEAVEAYPCLWNNESENYRNKIFVQNAWDKISEQFKDPVPACRERWRNIRNAFLRSMKRYPNDSENKRQYYLKSYLHFLRPFIKCKQNTIDFSDTEDTSNRVSESEEEMKPGAFLQVNQANDSTDGEPDTRSIQSNDDKIYAEPLSLSRNIFQQGTSNNDLRQQCAEAGKLPRKRRKINYAKEEEDPNMMFFKSLLRDVRKMTDRQNRKFRFRVMQIVDEILDDEVILPGM